MSSKTIKLMTLMFLVAGFSLFAFAQTETGQIGGVVTDPSGAVVAGVKVTAISNNTQTTRVVTSDSNGSYIITNLQPGIYDVKFEGQGFSEQTKKVQVTVGGRTGVNTALTVGAATTTVEVVGSGGVQVELEKSELSQVVSGKHFTESPSNDRNPYALVYVTPNVSNADPSGRGVGVAINGQRAASTSITLDGADNVDLFTASLAQSIPLDAVQEFRVINSNFGAEYGKASGGIVNVATKSGTNNFHGSVFEFYRGSALAANTYDNNANKVVQPRYVRNQFGYSVGGPIVKEKLFFFNSTEFIRVRSARTERVLVPTAQFVAAAAQPTRDFFAAFGTLASPINGAVITKADFTASGFSPTGPYAALPANTPIFGEVRYLVPVDAGGGDPQNQYQTTTRVDFNLTDKTTLFGRYSVQRADIFKGSVANSPYKGFNTGAEVYGANALISLTHVFTPTLVSNTKVVYNRNRSDQPLGENPPTPTLFFRNVTTRVTTAGGTLRVAGPGYLPFSPGSAIPFQCPQNLYEIHEDMNWTKGSHQVKFGMQLIHTRDNREFGAFQNSAQTLSTTSLGNGLDNFLNGLLAQFQGAIDPQGKFPCKRDANNVFIINTACSVVTPLGPPDFSRNNRFGDIGLYATDSWKIFPRLTVNLGVRWEYYGVQHNIDPKQDSNFYYGAGANIYEQIRNGEGFATPDSPTKGLWGKDYNNFAPRLGFAWDVLGNGKTSLRGGYGIGFERNIGNVTYNVLFNPPFFASPSINSTDVPAGTLTVTTSNIGPYAGAAGVSKPLTNLQLRHIDQNIRTAYAHNWNLSLEQELMKNTVASVSYSGSKGVDLYTLENPNRPGSGVIYLNDVETGTTRTSRLNRQYTNLNTRRNNGFSDYHAMITSVRSSDLFNQGLSFQAHYTWAHTIDNLSSTFSESANNFNLGLLDPFNPGLDKGSADFDIRHRLIVSSFWDLPYFKNSSNPALKYILGGWTFAPTFNAQSGAPFTIFDCSNFGAISQTCPRIIPTGAFVRKDGAQDRGPNANTYLILPTSTPVVNPVFGSSDFGLCTRGQGAAGPCPWPAGMSQRNAFKSPGIWNVDLGMNKNIKVSEGFSLQFRGELINAFNHSNLFVSGSSAEAYNDADTDAPDGRITSSRAGNRRIQLAVKIIF